MGDPPECISVKPTNNGIIGLTKPRSIFRNHVQHRLNIRRRTRDHAQDLTRCRLLLQGFGEVTVADLLLVNKPCVLDGNDRLIGECLK